MGGAGYSGAGRVQEIVAEWRKEMAREAADFSQADALDLMAIAPADVEGASPEAMMDILKKAYRRQALRLHPDKNPDGPEPFLKMQRAYQALMAMAQGEAEVGGGPRPARISLLLRAQCLLHRREPDVLGEFTYPAYDTLLALLHATMAEGLEHEHVQLCLELTWLTLNACPDNAPFLGDKGAVPVLAALLQQCRDAVPADAPASADHVVLATLTLRALALVLQSGDARSVVEELPGGDRAAFLRNLLWTAELPRATNAAAAAVATIAAAVASEPLRQELLGMAVLSTLFTRMLLCAPCTLACRESCRCAFQSAPASGCTLHAKCRPDAREASERCNVTVASTSADLACGDLAPRRMQHVASIPRCQCSAGSSANTKTGECHHPGGAGSTSRRRWRTTWTSWSCAAAAPRRSRYRRSARPRRRRSRRRRRTTRLRPRPPPRCRPSPASAAMSSPMPRSVLYALAHTTHACHACACAFLHC